MILLKNNKINEEDNLISGIALNIIEFFGS